MHHNPWIAEHAAIPLTFGTTSPAAAFLMCPVFTPQLESTPTSKLKL